MEVTAPWRKCETFEPRQAGKAPKYNHGQFLTRPNIMRIGIMLIDATWITP